MIDYVKCFHPINIRQKGKSPTDSFHYVQVPCGKCPACLYRYRDSWRVRLESDFKYFGFNGLFFTLTYDDDHLPYKVVDEDSGLMLPSLDKERISKFYKDIKNSYDYEYRQLEKKDRPEWSYFLCGEYGSCFQRPHYHMLLFCTKDYNDYWDSLIRSKWNDGLIYVLPTIPNRIQYVTKYTLKYRLQDCKDLGLTLPFARMSKGIGKHELEDRYFKEQHYSQFLPLMYDINGFPVALPRYYRNYMYNPEVWENYALKLSALSIEEEMKLLSGDLRFGVPDKLRLSWENDKVTEDIMKKKIDDSLKKNIL